MEIPDNFSPLFEQVISNNEGRVKISSPPAAHIMSDSTNEADDLLSVTPRSIGRT